jgi:hypothetical protein
MTMTEGNKYVLDYITANSYPAIDLQHRATGPSGCTPLGVAEKNYYESDGS